MTHDDVHHLVVGSPHYQEEPEQAAAEVAIMMSLLAAHLTRSQRIAFLSRCRWHMAQLIDLGLSDVGKADAVARMLGVFPR